MAYVSDICERSLRLVGIRDFTDTDRQTEAIAALNTMLTSWRLEMHHSLVSQSFSLIAGTASYTIGAAGVINSARPIRIISAFIRDSSGNDHEVDTDLAKIDYDKIVDKDSEARPTQLYYEPANPLGIIYFNSAPSAAETCYISSLKPYDSYAAVTDLFLLPIEYEKAVIYNLAIDLAPEYWVALDQNIVAQAIALKAEIESENFDPPVLAEIPSELLGLR